MQSAVSRQAPCSLRLSVRTPPFHGGESGSIPLGSATALDFASPPTLRSAQGFINPAPIESRTIQTGTSDHGSSQKTRRPQVCAAGGVDHPGRRLRNSSLLRARHVVLGGEDHGIRFKRVVGPGAARFFTRSEGGTSMQRGLAARTVVGRQVRQIAASVSAFGYLCGYHDIGGAMCRTKPGREASSPNQRSR